MLDDFFIADAVEADGRVAPLAGRRDEVAVDGHEFAFGEDPLGCEADLGELPEVGAQSGLQAAGALSEVSMAASRTKMN